MISFLTKTAGELIAIRLNRGDDILTSLQNVIKERNIQNGVVISGIGTVDKCVLHFVTDNKNAKAVLFKEWKDTALEVAGLQGIIANGVPHIHGIVSNSKQAWAGHIEPGCRTLFLCEILIMVFDGPGFDRVHATENPDDTDYAIMNLTQI